MRRRYSGFNYWSWRKGNVLRSRSLRLTFFSIDTKSFKLQTQKKVKGLEESFRRLLRKFEDSMQDVAETMYRDENEEKQ